MLLNKSFPYEASARVHLFIGGFLGIFVLFILFILFFLKPFNSGGSHFSNKTIYFLMYGFIVFFSYFITHLLSLLYYKSAQIWKVFEEIIFSVIFIFLAIIIGFYYTEFIINKNPERINLPHFLGWFKTILFSFGILLFILTFYLRRKYTAKDLKNENINSQTNIVSESRNITITGSLKKDFFVVDEANMVYVKSENNYVLISYFEDDLIKEKLLRSTLANIEKQLPSFIKTHRSYIVNPDFFLSLKGSKQNSKLNLKNTGLSIPVSETYFEAVNSLSNSPK